MSAFVSWISFFGAWLVFAGAIYQAALELIDQDIKRDRIKAAASTIKPPVTVSPLWWFLPPVKIHLERRRSRQYREKYLTTLPPEDVEALVNFMNKATAWLTVSTGGLFIGLRLYNELRVLPRFCPPIDVAIS